MNEDNFIKQGLQDIVLRRRSRNGRKPSHIAVEVHQENEGWKFAKPLNKFTDENRCRVMEAFIREVIHST